MPKIIEDNVDSSCFWG